jgi:hypothetical protein
MTTHLRPVLPTNASVVRKGKGEERREKERAIDIDARIAEFGALKRMRVLVRIVVIIGTG